jgi:hypothetical protein
VFHRPRRTLRIHTTDDLTLEGVDAGVTRRGEYVLDAAALLTGAKGRDEVGQVLVPRVKVRFVQVMR